MAMICKQCEFSAGSQYCRGCGRTPSEVVEFLMEQKESEKKIFYNWNEWSGWRFYLKAIWNKDWKSLKGHLKDTYCKSGDKTDSD